MAGEESPFNPEPQTEQPGNYIYWSRPITEPKANVSSEIALKGAGEAIKGGVELGIAGEENSIRNDIYQKTDQLNDQYIQRLSQADTLIGGNSGNVDQPPKDTGSLKRLPGALETLSAARDNGKMSETYYYQQLYGMAKQMRSQNPMFRDYIDNQFSRITKEQPANDLIKSLTGDINAYAANAREQHNKTENVLMSAAKEGMLGKNGAGIVMAYKQGNLSEAAALDYVARAGARRWDDENTKNALTIKRESIALNQEEGARAIAPMINNQIQTWTDAATIPVGGNNNYMNLHDVYKGLNDGTIKVTPEQQNQLARAAQQQRDDIYARGLAWMSQTDKNGNSIIGSSFGGDTAKAKAALDLAMGPANNLSKLYADGELSVAKMAEANVKAIETGAKQFWYNDQTVGQYMQMTKGLLEIGGNSPAAANWQILSQPSGDMATYMKGLYTQSLTGMVTQATGDARAPNPGDAARIGTPITLNDAIERAKQGGYNGTSAARLYRGWVDSLSAGLGNKKIPVPMRVNLATATYSESNTNLMSQFPNDTISDKGQPVPGKGFVFGKLVNDAISSAMKKLTDDSPQSWEDYKKSGFKWFRDASRGTLSELNDLSDKVDKGANYKVTWDDQNLQWNIDMGPSKPYSGLGDIFYTRPHELQDYLDAKAHIANLNKNIDSLKSVAKQDHTVDVNDEVVRLMLEEGLNPKLLPQKLIQAFTKAQSNDN